MSLIALCDMNAYYCSNETIFRPELIGKPIVTLSNNDGAIVSITPEAKALGIKKFAPYFQQRALIEKHNVTVFSSNYVNYGYVSERIMKTLAAHAPIHEVYSIDEIFCDVTNVSDIKGFGGYIKKLVFKEHRIPMGVGISHTKTLAKLANHAAKKIPKLQGVCVADTQEKVDWLIRHAKTDDIWGVGQGLAARLAKSNILDAVDLKQLNSKRARQIGGVILERIVSELNGISCLELETVTNERKEIVSSRSFGTKTNNLDDIQSALASHITKANEKLRRQHGMCRYIRVSIQTSRHIPEFEQYFNTASSGLTQPTSDIRTLTSVGIDLLSRIYPVGRKTSIFRPRI